MSKQAEYEYHKQRIQAKNLPPREYEAAIARLAKKLKI